MLVSGSGFDATGSAGADVAVWEMLDDTAIRDLLDECADDTAVADDVVCDEVDDALTFSTPDAGATIVPADPDDVVEIDEVDEFNPAVVCADGVTCCGVCSEDEQPVNAIINAKQAVGTV